MTDDKSTAPPDVLKLLQAALASPAAAKAAIADLVAALTKHDAAATAAKAEQQKLADLKQEVETGIAVLRTKTEQELAVVAADHDRRVAQREVELTARERRASELEAKATEHEAKTAKIRGEYERRERAWNSA